MMKLKTDIFTATGLTILFLLFGSCISVFGQSSEEELLPVKIIQPIKGEQIEPVLADVKVVSDIQVIKNQIELSSGEVYESPYFEVGEYRNVGFYVEPKEGFLSTSQDIYYQLDAFFSLESIAESILKMGATQSTRSSTDWQEFGNTLMGSEGTVSKSSFTLLTTGKTMSRVLYTNVYGPFVRVVLKNLTPENRCKFKITMYLTR